MIRHLALCLIAVITPAIVVSQELSLRNFNVDQGLSQSNVMCLWQDRHGFMWLGTEDGLNKFDGYRFTVFKHDAADSTSLPNHFIRGLAEDDQGDLWVATDRRLCRYDSRKEIFVRWAADSSSASYPGHYVYETFYRGPSGEVWLGTWRQGVGRLREDQFVADVAESLGTSRVSCVYEDRQGGIWYGTSVGIFRMSKDRTVVRLDEGLFNADFHVHSPKFIREDSAGAIWIGLFGKGVFRLNADLAVARHYAADPKEADGMATNDVNCLLIDPFQCLWLGTENGLHRYDAARDRFMKVRTKKGPDERITTAIINALWEDRGGLIWVATNGSGVFVHNPSRRKFAHYFHDPQNPNSLSHNMVYALFEEVQPSGRIVWIGTDGGGMDRLNRETGTFGHYSTEKGSPRLTNNSVRVIRRDRSGRLWVGTSGGGLNVIDGRSVLVYANDPNNPFSIRRNSIRTILEDDGVVWIGTNHGGLNRLEADRRTFKHFVFSEADPTSLSSNLIRCVYHDRSGALWIGTQGGGLNRFDKRTGLSERFQNVPGSLNSLASDIVLSIVEDTIHAPGILWLGTAGGLDRLDMTTRTFTHFTERQGLPNNVVYTILADGHGRLWLTTNRGLCRFDPRTGENRNYDVQDGLQSDEFNAGAGFCNERGEMFIGGINGFNIFHPDSIRDDPFEPPVVLTAFHLFNRPVKPAPDGILRVTLTETAAIELDDSENAFSFEFAALGFAAPEKNAYAYRMEGFDDEWIYCGNRRFAAYTNLDPGTYVFRVKGSNQDGVWSAKVASIRLTVRPPFYHTWWFRILALGAMIAWVYGGIRFRKYYAEYRRTRYIGSYKIIRKLGSGGMGSVFQAYDKSNRQVVALKILHPELAESAEALNRFMKEAEIGQRLRHDHVVRIFTAGTRHDVRYLAMEYVEGVTLKHLVRSHHPLEEAEIRRIGGQILDGLQAIHDMGVIHRDLKSDNIMVKPDGSVKIMDFGLARIQALTSVADRSQLVGTLAYMSPEQSIGKTLDHRTDMYSFGVILFEMVNNRLPFHGQNEMELIMAIHNETPVLDDGPFTAIIGRCLQKDAGQRYAHVTDLISDFERR